MHAVRKRTAKVKDNQLEPDCFASTRDDSSTVHLAYFWRTYFELMAIRCWKRQNMSRFVRRWAAPSHFQYPAALQEATFFGPSSSSPAWRKAGPGHLIRKERSRPENIPRLFPNKSMIVAAAGRSSPLSPWISNKSLILFSPRQLRFPPLPPSIPSSHLVFVMIWLLFCDSSQLLRFDIRPI